MPSQIPTIRSRVAAHLAEVVSVIFICSLAQSAWAQSAWVQNVGIGMKSRYAAVPTETPAATPASSPAAAATPAIPKADLPAAGGDVFGSQIFRGQFAARSFTGFNPDYQLAPGDRISLRLWGAYTLDAVQVVDAQGNIFIPNIGPVRVQGIRNSELNDLIQQQIRRVFRANVQSYASLDAAQPVKIYVTGFVRQPGLYNGLSSDSVLHYLDQAGGIDPDRGSYLAVDVLRAGKLRTRIDLYRFLLEGQIEPLQLHDGDTVLVAPRQFSARISGTVVNANVFELRGAAVSADTVLALAQPRPGATHLSIVRSLGGVRRSEYHPIANAPSVLINAGDEVTVMTDTVPGTLLVRLEGAHRGPRTTVLPYGARLRDALAQVIPAPQARMDALQLFRKSVAVRQKEMLALSLEKLETQALTARSATIEEANLRTREADLILQFTARARTVETKGQLVIAQLETAGDTLLEDGDVLFVPEESSQVTLHGEVMFPLALHHEAGQTVAEYIRQAGGYTQNADTSRVLLIRRNGSVVEVQPSQRPEPGEELMVLQKVGSKSIEIARGITQILYQIAIATKVVLGF